MLRTYGRRNLSKRSDTRAPDPPPSPPRKRQRVYVEIVSPRRKTVAQHKSPPSSEQNLSDFMSSDTNIRDFKSSDTKIPNTGNFNSVSRLDAASAGSPKTPERYSKDYSNLFATPPHHSRSGTLPKRGSVVKSMLGRSKTESSLPATPSSMTPPTAASTARLASWHALPTTFQERESTPEASSQSPPKPLPTRNVRTYAGSSRSFLVALPVPDADPLSTVDDEMEPHESYTDLRNRWGIDMSEDDPQPYTDERATVSIPLKHNASEISQSSLPAGMMNDLKSITELRSKGESRRFLDEVGYLFEGLDGSSAIGLRRASALEIVNKLCDVDFNRRAKTSDFYIRTWEKSCAARVGANDKIFDATVAFFAALAARDPHTLSEVAQQETFIPTLVEILSAFEHRKDILGSVLACCSDEALKLRGVSRTDITALKALARLVSKEPHFTSPTQLSTRFFISHSLASIPPSLLSYQHLPPLLISLRAELSLLEPRIAAYESGLPILPPTSLDSSDTPSLYHIEACLRLLDSYLLGHWSTASDNSSNRLSHISEVASELMSLCFTSSIILEEDDEWTAIARMCLCGAMRVLTLLSHDDPWWCGATLEVSDALPFATRTMMRSQAHWSQLRDTESQGRSVEAFDALCLALGLVMNWAAFTSKMAVLSRSKSLNPTCPGSRSCARACQCPDQKSVLECIVMLYGQYVVAQQDSSPEYAFLRGYTAILIGLLVQHDAANQAIVWSMLPGTSSSERIRSLITHCRSFLVLYDDDDTAMLSASSDVSQAMLSEAVADNGNASSHRMSWDRKGKETAQSVIAALESLL